MHMNLNDLWIGDAVRLKSSGKIGIYLGVNPKGRARVKCGYKVVLSSSQNIEIHEGVEKQEEELELLPIKPSQVVMAASLPKEYDLHIEYLNPTLTHEAPQIILNHQLKKCKEYVEQVISARLNMVTIIHGKGKGQLKLEVNFLLSQYDEFNYSIPTNDGGASEVWFKYV